MKGIHVLIHVIFILVTKAFQPVKISKLRIPTIRLSLSAFSDLDPAMKLNFDKVHYCAENVGMCSIEEMEEMEKALHTERIQHSAVGIPLDPLEELDHRILEKELRDQIHLLKNHMGSFTSGDYPAIITQSRSTGDINQGSIGTSMKIDRLSSFFSQGRDLFLIPFDVTEMLMYVVALMFLFILPNVINH